MSSEQNDDTHEARSAQRIGERAEARALAALAAAAARARDAVAAADDRARQRIADAQRKTPTLPDWRILEYLHEEADSSVAESDPRRGTPTHDTIALHAYFKAEQRRFRPGHEIEDWLQAERELLTRNADSR